MYNLGHEGRTIGKRAEEAPKMAAKVICRSTANSLEPEWPLIGQLIYTGFQSFHEDAEVEFIGLEPARKPQVPSMCFELVHSDLKRPELEVIRANLMEIMERRAKREYAVQWLIWTKGFPKHYLPAI